MAKSQDLKPCLCVCRGGGGWAQRCVSPPPPAVCMPQWGWAQRCVSPQPPPVCMPRWGWTQRCVSPPACVRATVGLGTEVCLPSPFYLRHCNYLTERGLDMRVWDLNQNSSLPVKLTKSPPCETCVPHMWPAKPTQRTLGLNHKY